MRALVRVHRKRQFPKQLLQRRRARRRHHAVVSRDILDAQDIVRVAVRARRREHARRRRDARLRADQLHLAHDLGGGGADGFVRGVRRLERRRLQHRAGGHRRTQRFFYREGRTRARTDGRLRLGFFLFFFLKRFRSFRLWRRGFVVRGQHRVGRRVRALLDLVWRSRVVSASELRFFFARLFSRLFPGVRERGRERLERGSRTRSRRPECARSGVQGSQPERVEEGCQRCAQIGVRHALHGHRLAGVDASQDTRQVRFDVGELREDVPGGVHGDAHKSQLLLGGASRFPGSRNPNLFRMVGGGVVVGSVAADTATR
mmetsp:Transcript_5587/g.23634  ORF Transcript_5587/g.23634 Transcript_5587/m.23634 type:complete len:317 (-) Transcript_5587:421-1371(-)